MNIFSEEKLPYHCFLTVEFDNLWFMDFKLIPKSDMCLLLAKYDEEILKIVVQYDNAQKPLEKYMGKLLKQDLSIEKSQDISKSYCIKVKDSFQANIVSFVVIIKDISLNQLEFKLNIRKSVFQMLDNHQNLINYLEKEVLGKIFQ